MSKYRVEVAYGWRKSKRPGVLLGMTIDAEDEDDALAQAEAQVIKPYPARRLLQITVEEQQS